MNPILRKAGGADEKIAILTDSNCGISPQEGKEQGIYILPMPVIIQEQIFYEGYEINEQQFYERLQNGNSVTTSQPSAGVVMESWERLLEHYGEVVYIPMSSSLSGSCQTAQLLAEEEPFRGRVHVVDNHRISVTQAQSVYDAKRMAKQGYSGEMIRKTLEKRGNECDDLYYRRFFDIFKERRQNYNSGLFTGDSVKFETNPYDTRR